VYVGVPGPVTSLQYSTMQLLETSVSLLLTWEEPFSNFNPIDHYTVSGCTRTDSMTGITRCPNITVFSTTEAAVTNFRIDQLPSNSRYTFMVTAANSLGNGRVVSISVSTMTMTMNTCKLTLKEYLKSTVAAHISLVYNVYTNHTAVCMHYVQCHGVWIKFATFMAACHICTT